MFILRLTIVIFLLYGCASTNTPVNEQSLYKVATKNLNHYKYNDAIDNYTQLLTKYPNSNHISSSLINLTKAYEFSGKSKDSLNTLQQYLKLYPKHRDLVLYLKAQILYNAYYDNSIRVFHPQRNSLDSTLTIRAMKNINELLAKYPNSNYIKAARRLQGRIIDTLAKSELKKAIYYYSIKAYIAANNRLMYLIEHYNTSSYLKQAKVLQHEVKTHLKGAVK